MAALSCSKKTNRDTIILHWVTDNNPARLKQIRVFERLNPGIKVKLTIRGDRYDEIILTQLASGKPSFDLLDCYSPDELTSYIKRGALYDITDHLKKDGIDIDIFWEPIKNYILRDGRIYGIPCNAGNIVLWYNKKLFRQVGLDDIEKKLTWEELKGLAEKLTIRDPATGRITQFGFQYKWWWMEPILIWQSGGEYIDTNSRSIGFNNETFRKYFKMIHDMMFGKNRSIPDEDSLKSLQTEGSWAGGSLFPAGSVAMELDGRWRIAEYRKYKGLEYDYAPLPYIKGKTPYNIFTTRSTVIPKNSPNREAAYQFLKYMTTDAYHNTILNSGDGVPSVKSFIKKDSFLHPKFEDEKRNYIYVDEMKYARSYKTYEEIDYQKYFSEVFRQNMDWYMKDNAINIDELLLKINEGLQDYY